MPAFVATTIEAFGRDEWNALFPDDLEDFAYYRAVEASAIPGFSWLYFGVRENGVLRAAVAAFITDYPLDTTVTGALRHVTRAVARVLPRLMNQRLLSLGSPVTETCHLGFSPDCNAAERDRLLAAILCEVEAYGRAQRIQMIAVKDAGSRQDEIWSDAGEKSGLRRQPGLPTAWLDIDFSSIDEYLERLSSGTRKDMRRKLRAGEALRVEWRDNIDDIQERVTDLYLQTRANAEFNFEELTGEYFAAVLREMPGRASCATYWLGDRLVAFNLLLHDGKCLLDKFLGMDYSVAREYNLYFYTWFENVRWCIEHRVPVYQSGQGLHREKLRLGSRIEANWIWYRHRNRLIDRILAALEGLARLDREDPELAKLQAPDAPTRRRPSWGAWITLLSLELICQIALKSAGLAIGEAEFSWNAAASALGSPWLWLAIATYIGQFVTWMTILRNSSLSGAFPTSAITIVGVVIASAVLFAEPMGWLRVLGATIIVFGILLLGQDEPHDDGPLGIDRNKPLG